MALEHSVLDEQKIIELLKEYWNISVVKAEKLPLGSANCYYVLSETQQYFLKEFQSDFKPADLQREADLANYLVEHGIPTARFIPTMSSKMYIEYQGHCICLEEYMEGMLLVDDIDSKKFLTKLFYTWKSYSQQVLFL